MPAFHAKNRTGSSPKSAKLPAFAVASTLYVIAMLLVASGSTHAASGYAFTEDWEFGLGGWSITGSGASQDCSRGNPGCSLAINPACCGSYVRVARDLNVGFDGITRFSFYFMGSATKGDTDARIDIALSGGGALTLGLTEGGAESNNVIVLSNNAFGSTTVYAWPSANTWYQLSVVFDPTRDKARAEVHSASGQVLASSHELSIPPGSDAVQSITFVGVFWTTRSVQHNYDTLRVAYAPKSPQSVGTQRGPGAGEITVSWQPPVDSGSFAVTGYRVYRSTSSTGPYQLIDEVGNVLTYTDKGLPNGTTRYYKISAISPTGEGSLSAAASGTSPAGPSAPEALRATTGPSFGQITLTWETPTDSGGVPLTGYRIYRGTSPSNTRHLTDTGLARVYVDSGLSGGVYFYRVSAVNSAGLEGATSNEASATAVDQTFNRVSIGAPPLNVSWNVPAASTPYLPPQRVEVPPVKGPATCTLQLCTSPTTIPEQTAKTPEIPGQSTPYVPMTCVPTTLVCVGPIPSIPLTPTIPSFELGSTPPVTAPAVCAAASAICLPETPIFPGAEFTTPEVQPIPLTPAVTVAASSEGFTLAVEPHFGENRTIGPITVNVGPVPVTLCATPCPVPVSPTASAQGSVTITIRIGETVFTRTVTVSYP